MERRYFLAGAAASALTACAAGSKGIKSTNENKFSWKMAIAVPKTWKIWGEAMVRFSQRVESMSLGQLSIRVYGAGEMVQTEEIFDAVKDGNIEMGHAAAYYWRGKVPAAQFFTAVPFGMNAQGMYAWINGADGQALWDKLYSPFGLKALPCGSTGMQMGGWFRKPIKSVADFKGLKMRLPGLGGEVITRLGASAVFYSGQELYTNLSTGVIDATEWIGPFHDQIIGFHKIAPYYYSIGWHEPGSILELLINKEKWESLPVHLQEIVTACSAQINNEMYGEWMAKDAQYFQKILSNKKINVQPFPKDVLKALQEKSVEVLSELRETSPIAKEIHDSFYSFKKIFDAYQNINERSYFQI